MYKLKDYLGEFVTLDKNDKPILYKLGPSGKYEKHQHDDDATPSHDEIIVKWLGTENRYTIELH